jgi:HEAT repeat protein
MPDDIASVMAKLQDPDVNVRIWALDEIGTRRPPDALAILGRGLDDPDVKIRVAAACNLGDLGDPRALPWLIAAVNEEESEEVRGEAIAALANFSSREVLECLAAVVRRQKQSRRPRQEVAKQLGNYDTEEAVNALIVLLSDEDVFVREYAAESLFRLNRPRLGEVWRQAGEDLSEDVRHIAAKALAALK